MIDTSIHESFDFLLQAGAVEGVEFSLEGEDGVVIERGLVDLHGMRPAGMGSARAGAPQGDRILA